MKQLRWRFPLPRTHTGLPLGNGVLGVLLWGESDTLRITLGRADWWDRRGGSHWRPEMSYAAIRRHLAAGDEEGLGRLFRSEAARPGEPARPTVLPVGRIDLSFAGASLRAASLDLRRGSADLGLRQGDARLGLSVAMAMDRPVVILKLPRDIVPVVQPVPAWQYVGEQLAKVSFEPPQRVDECGWCGWVQSVPADPACAVLARRQGDELAIAVQIGATPDAARAAAIQLVDEALTEGFDALRAAAARWWADFYRQAAEVSIPNRRLQALHDVGLYKFATLTQPQGVAATLQGPWVEEYRLPPWSNDYHFNINVQMCYQPAYHGNCLEHLRPLFDMVMKWEPILRHNARCFVGIDDGLLLPHAVSDNCVFISSYWGHSVDHGCTAWVAQMMFRYYRYTLDRQFLRDTAYPFMVGAMRVYEEMLERTSDGRWRLPIGISPEYFTPDKRGYGVNASFQLAAIHRLLEDLQEAAATLGVEPRAVWRDIQQGLPKACQGPTSRGKERIVLWEKQDLDESHRHHSHLAGITPFDVLDPADPQWEPIIRESLAHWLYRGPGLWSGWCIPWASCLHSHVGNGGAAELWLEIFERVFTNQGRGTLHDAEISGFTLMGVAPTGNRGERMDIMQLDGGMGSVAAIQEMLLHTRRGVTHIFAGVPIHWRSARFRRLRTDGAVLVSAVRRGGVTRKVILEPQCDVRFRLANPFPGPVEVHSGTEHVETRRGAVLELDLRAGGRIQLTMDQDSV